MCVLWFCSRQFWFELTRLGFNRNLATNSSSNIYGKSKWISSGISIISYMPFGACNTFPMILQFLQAIWKCIYSDATWNTHCKHMWISFFFSPKQLPSAFLNKFTNASVILCVPFEYTIIIVHKKKKKYIQTETEYARRSTAW